MVKNPPANAGDAGSIPGLGPSLGKGNGSPLQCSCLENPMDRGAWGLQSMGSQTVRQDLAAEHTPIPGPELRVTSLDSVLNFSG